MLHTMETWGPAGSSAWHPDFSFQVASIQPAFRLPTVPLHLGVDSTRVFLGLERKSHRQLSNCKPLSHCRSRWSRQWLYREPGPDILQVIETWSPLGQQQTHMTLPKNSIRSAAVTMKWSSSGSCVEEAGREGGSKPWTSGGLTLASARSYREESRGPRLSKAGGSKSAGRCLNVTSSMLRSNASPWDRNQAKEAGDLHG